MATYDKPTTDFIKSFEDKIEKKIEAIQEHPVGEALRAAKTTTMLGQPKNIVMGIVRKGIHDNLVSEKIASLTDPLEIFAVMNKSFGRDWFDWEPETIWKTIGGNTELEPKIRNIILCLQVLVKTNQVHEQWHIFENAVHAFNGNHVDFSTLQPCELNEIAKAIKIIRKVRPTEDFDSEVYIYIATVAKTSGVVYLPEDLFGRESQDHLDNLVNDLELKKEVQNRWPNGPKSDDSLALKIQLLRLKEILDYA